MKSKQIDCLPPKFKPEKIMKTNHQTHQSILRLLAALVLFAMLCALTAPAATIYWDGSGTLWSAVASWSTASGATTPDPAAVPGASDVPAFNITTVNAAQTVYLNGARSANSLAFTNTSTTTLLGGISGTPAVNTLTLGSSSVATTILTEGASAGAV